jgi:hypothetical protein
MASRPDRTLVERWKVADADRDHRKRLIEAAFAESDALEYPRTKWELLKGLPLRPDELGDVSAPWLATPVSYVGTVYDGPYEGPYFQREVGIVGERIDVTNASSSTRDPLYWRVRNMNLRAPGQPRPEPRRRYLVGEDGRASNDLRVAAELIESSADHQLSQLFADAPSLRLEVRDPEQWYTKDPVRWTATVGDTQGLDLSDLGSAHQRYAVFAIQQAVYGHDGRPAFAIIDEPERALHRAAEDRLCAALPSLAEYVIVASHSTSFLDADGALVHATRPGTRLRLDSEPPQADTRSIRDLAAVLGVRRSDITARWRVIVLVEGPHDEAVIGAFCQDVLRRPDVHVVCLGGTYGLEHLASATRLFDLTDATLLVVTDNASADHFATLHGGLVTRGNDKARHGLLDDTRNRRDNSQEFKALLAMLTAAVNAGTIDRFAAPFGFERPDIVHYLPAQEFLPGCETWDDISRRFLDEHGQRSFHSGDGRRLKKWVNDQTGGAYKVPAIRNLAERLAAKWGERPGGLAANRPPEFSALAERILEQLDRSYPKATAADS